MVKLGSLNCCNPRVQRIHKSLQAITSLGKFRNWNKIILSHSCPSPPWYWMRPLPTQLCCHLHSGMFLPFPRSPFLCTAAVQSRWVLQRGGRATLILSECGRRREGLLPFGNVLVLSPQKSPRGWRAEGSTCHRSSDCHHCHTGGGHRKQPFQESFQQEAWPL